MRFQSDQRQGGECVSHPGGSAGGGVEKTPAGDYSINTPIVQHFCSRRFPPVLEMQPVAARAPQAVWTGPPSVAARLATVSSEGDHPLAQLRTRVNVYPLKVNVPHVFDR
jgi:hypothetical protein